MKETRYPPIKNRRNIQDLFADIFGEFPLSNLPYRIDAHGGHVYDPEERLIKYFLDRTWHFGWNPLAISLASPPRSLSVRLPDGSLYSYAEPQTVQTYMENNEEKRYFHSVVPIGCIEHALRSEDAVFFSHRYGIQWEPRWTPRKKDTPVIQNRMIPDDISYMFPPERYFDCIVDSEMCAGKNLDIFHLSALVPECRGYINTLCSLQT